MDTLEFISTNLHMATLESFGVQKQFYQLEFSSEVYDSILFIIDCDFTFSGLDEKANKLFNYLKELDSDVYKVSYMVAINRKTIQSCSLTGSNFILKFDNGIIVSFNLLTPFDYPLSILLKKDFSESVSSEIIFDTDGSVEINIK